MEERMGNMPRKDSARRKREKAFRVKGVKAVRPLGSGLKFDGSGR